MKINNICLIAKFKFYKILILNIILIITLIGIENFFNIEISVLMIFSSSFIFLIKCSSFIKNEISNIFSFNNILIILILSLNIFFSLNKKYNLITVNFIDFILFILFFITYLMLYYKSFNIFKNLGIIYSKYLIIDFIIKIFIIQFYFPYTFIFLHNKIRNKILEIEKNNSEALK